MAERLGITEEDLKHRLDFFGDLTMTELRLLAISTNVRIMYVWVDEPEYKMVDERDPECVERWPDCESFKYDSRCCRFPKNCSAGGFKRVDISPIKSADE